MKTLSKFLSEDKPHQQLQHNVHTPDLPDETRRLRSRARNAGDRGNAEMLRKANKGNAEFPRTQQPLATPTQTKNYVNTAREVTSKAYGSTYGDKQDPIDRALALIGPEALRQKKEENPTEIENRKKIFAQNRNIEQGFKKGKTVDPSVDFETISGEKVTNQLDPSQKGFEVSAAKNPRGQAVPLTPQQNMALSGGLTPDQVAPEKTVQQAKTGNELLAAADSHLANKKTLKNRMSTAADLNQQIGIADPVSDVDSEVQQMRRDFQRSRQRGNNPILFPDTNFEKEISDRYAGEHMWQNSGMGLTTKNPDGTNSFGKEGVNKLIAAISDKTRGAEITPAGAKFNLYNRELSMSPHSSIRTPSARQIQTFDPNARKDIKDPKVQEFESKVANALNRKNEVNDEGISGYDEFKKISSPVSVPEEDVDALLGSLDKESLSAFGLKGLATARKKGVYGGDLGPEGEEYLKDKEKQIYDYNKLERDSQSRDIIKAPIASKLLDKLMSNRTRSMAKTYLSQGGVDAYSPHEGVRSPNDMDLEHVHSMQGHDGGGYDGEGNWVFGSRNINLGRKTQDVGPWVSGFNNGNVNFRNYPKTEQDKGKTGDEKINQRFLQNRNNYLNTIEKKLDPEVKGKFAKGLSDAGYDPENFDLNQMTSMGISGLKKLRKSLEASGIPRTQVARLTKFPDYSVGTNEYDEIRLQNDKDQMKGSDIAAAIDNNRSNYVAALKKEDEDVTDRDALDMFNQEKERLWNDFQTKSFAPGDSLVRRPGTPEYELNNPMKRRGQPTADELRSQNTYFGIPKVETKPKIGDELESDINMEDDFTDLSGDNFDEEERAEAPPEPKGKTFNQVVDSIPKPESTPKEKATAAAKELSPKPAAAKKPGGKVQFVAPNDIRMQIPDKKTPLVFKKGDKITPAKLQLLKQYNKTTYEKIMSQVLEELTFEKFMSIHK